MVLYSITAKSPFESFIFKCSIKLSDQDLCSCSSVCHIDAPENEIFPCILRQSSGRVAPRGAGGHRLESETRWPPATSNHLRKTDHR